MRDVIPQEFVTLDGQAAGPNNSVDFVPASTRGDHTFGQEQSGVFEAIDTILLGRITYQMFAGYWPNVTEGDEKLFADKMNTTPKIVVSRTLERAPWGTWKDASIVTGDAAAEVRTLKQQAGKGIVIWGSISLAQSLTMEKLIDEYQLVICPLVLGAGRPLFGDDVQPFEMTLSKVTPLDRGAVLVKYSPHT